MSIRFIFGRFMKKKVRTTTLKCPSCKGDQLGIRQRTGPEFFISALTDTRKYRCFTCLKEFRAPDRRRIARATTDDRESVVLPHPV